MTRRDPHGNALPHRLHHRHGRYYHVSRVGGRVVWRALSQDYADALREWAEAEGSTLQPRTIAETWAVYQGSTRGLLRLAPGTQRNYRDCWRRVAPVWGHLPLDDGRRSDVLAYLEARERAGRAVAGNREVEVLACIYRFARERDWTDQDPCKVSRNRERPRRRVATAAELAALALAAAPQWRAALALYVLTGARPSEVRLLRRDDVTDEGLVIRRPKTGAESVILWSEALREAVAAARACHRPAVSLWLLPSPRGGPWSEAGWSVHWRRLRVAAGCPDLQLRDLRRTVATGAETLERARALLGHARTDMTARVYRVRDRVEPAG